MEIKSNVANLTAIENLEDIEYLKNNTNTCKNKLVLFKYGVPEKELWLPEDVKNIIINKHILLEVELQKFLKLVAEGEQDQAEAMLQDNPDLCLLAGDVTDLSKRSFNNITGFQYAVWALDFHMWTMLLKYLKPEAITKQLEDMETGSWVEAHGKSASWQNLNDALYTYIKLCGLSRGYEAENQWKRNVGDAQAMLPIHVVNEYCHPTRSFHPCPNFKDATPIPRSRKTGQGEWFTAKYNGSELGTGSFAYRRGFNATAQASSRVHFDFCIAEHMIDSNAIYTLLANRVEQRQALFADYPGNKPQEQCVLI